MIAFPESLGQLRKLVDTLISICGENARVGFPDVKYKDHSGQPAVVYLGLDMQVELVYVDRIGCVIGDEANMNTCPPGCFTAVMVSDGLMARKELNALPGCGGKQQ